MKNTKIQFFTRSRKVAQGSSRNTNDFFLFFFSKFLRGEPWEALRLRVKIAFIPVPLHNGVISHSMGTFVLREIRCEGDSGFLWDHFDFASSFEWRLVLGDLKDGGKSIRP